MSTPNELLKLGLDLHRQGNHAGAEQVYQRILGAEPNHPGALHYQALIEEMKGNRDVAIEMMQRSLAIKPDQPALLNNLGGTFLEMDRVSEAVTAFERAVKLKASYPIGYQNLARALQRAGKVQESIAASDAQLKLDPGNPIAVWNIELCNRELVSAPKNHVEATEKWFSVGVTCFGDFPQYSVRCVESLAAGEDPLKHCDIHVGCNTVSQRTIEPLRVLLDNQKITTLIESNRNLNKSPIMRQNLGLTRTPYILIVDDDSHVRPGWDEAIVRFIEENHPFDVAGHIFNIDRDAEYQKLVEPKPWWKGIDAGHPAYRTKVFLATGGMYLARAAFLRQYNYPDRSMIIWREDAMLSDLTNQVGGRLLRFPSYVMDRVRINDGQRRGEDIMTVIPATDEDLQTRA